jgi:myosin heavy subunit
MQIGMLEDLRQRTLHGIIGIQKVYKGHKVRCYYRQLRSASVVLQSVVRGALARRQYKDLQQRHHASVMIQKYVRTHVLRHSYLQTRKKVVLVQAVVRMWLAKRRLQCLSCDVEDQLAADAAVNKAGDDSAHVVEANTDQDKSEESIEACSVSTVPSLVEAVSSEVLISV